MRSPPFLERALWKAVVEFNRSGWTRHRLEFLPRDHRPFHDEDGLWTYHRQPFVVDDDFQRAYGRAVRAGGFDYCIRWRAHTLLWAAEAAARLKGAFVECGTGRGFMASAVCEYLGWRNRPFYLFDTFKPTMPNEAGLQTDDQPICRFYASSAEDVAKNFAEWPAVQLVVGQVPETLEQHDIPQVAFLHIDMNNGPAEEAAVRHFWPRLVRGGLMIFDDYGLPGYEMSADAADTMAAEFGFSVLASPTGQGLVIKD